MKVYAIIVTYNAMQKGWIKRCLDSLVRSSCPVTPIVVDNGSTDGTRDYVPANYPDVVWLPQERNLGFGQANNIGLRFAIDNQADYVLLLNQDAAIDRDAIRFLLLESDNESLVSPLHLNGKGDAFDYMFKGALQNADNRFFDDFIVSGKPRSSYETGEICAACWLMPISLIRKIGGFNPLYFHYGEDNNYYQRLVYHKIKVLVATKALMYHDRVVHGNMEIFNKDKLHRDILNIVCNINNSCRSIFGGLVLRLLKCYYSDFPRKQYKVGCFCKELFWLCGKVRTISASRKNERQKKLNWL